MQLVYVQASNLFGTEESQEIAYLYLVGMLGVLRGYSWWHVSVLLVLLLLFVCKY